MDWIESVKIARAGAMSVGQRTLRRGRGVWGRVIAGMGYEPGEAGPGVAPMQASAGATDGGYARVAPATP